MKTKNRGGYGWIAFASLAGSLLSAALLGVFSVFAQSPAGPPDSVVINFTEPLVPVPITDPAGNAAGEGVLFGQARCIIDHCSGKTELSFTAPLTEPLQLEYKFSSRQAADPIAEIVILSGRGTISSNGQKERFAFTAIFRNNPDGTLSATFAASRPDASWVIPSTPGRMDFSSP